MTTNNDSKGHVKYGARIIAVALVSGGVLGILMSAVTGAHFAPRDNVRVISTIISAALYAWAIPTGVSLWRETPRGFTWATILVALQVPVFSIARVVYEFSTLFSFRVMIGNTTHNIGGNIGSSSNVYLLPQSLGFMCGVNIAAVLALLYLIRGSRSARRRSLGGAQTERPQAQHERPLEQFAMDPPVSVLRQTPAIERPLGRLSKSSDVGCPYRKSGLRVEGGLTAAYQDLRRVKRRRVRLLGTNVSITMSLCPTTRSTSQ